MTLLYRLCDAATASLVHVADYSIAHTAIREQIGVGDEYRLTKQVRRAGRERPSQVAASELLVLRELLDRVTGFRELLEVLEIAADEQLDALHQEDDDKLAPLGDERIYSSAGLTPPMSRPIITLLLCSALLLLASCGGFSDGTDDTVPPGTTGGDTPIEGDDGPPDDRPGDPGTGIRFADPLDDADRAAIVTAVRKRAAADGAAYDFDTMEPLFDEDGDTIELTFHYRDENTIGGAPVARLSRRSGDITSIRYTR